MTAAYVTYYINERTHEKTRKTKIALRWFEGGDKVKVFDRKISFLHAIVERFLDSMTLMVYLYRREGFCGVMRQYLPLRFRVAR